MRVRNMAVGVVIGTTMGAGISRGIRWWRTWGIDPEVSTEALPGDDIVPVTSAQETRSITIDAPPEAIWPWLVQMGYGRAGWYSYDTLDNRAKSVERIVPEWQSIGVGEVMPHSPGGGFEVRAVEPGRALVLSMDTALLENQMEAVTAQERKTAEKMPTGLAASSSFLATTPKDFAVSWAFVLEPLDGGRTRFVERFRVRFGDAGPSFRVIRPVMGFGVFLMLQRQMLGIKARAERTVVVTPLVAVPEPIREVARNGHKPAEVHANEVLATPVG
jgi:uncharacterized protein YndB with AHSA1/START domain